MVFKNLIMKKILLILLMCLNYTSYSQDFVRVIDTVLILDVSSQTNVSNNVYGSFISPPTGKVWKIQSLLLDPGNNLDAYCCNAGCLADGDVIISFVEIDDGANQSLICSSSPTGNKTYNGGSGLYSTGPAPKIIKECTENIIWINSTSTIKIGIIETPNYFSADVCVDRLTVTAHISILEFEN